MIRKNNVKNKYIILIISLILFLSCLSVLFLFNKNNYQVLAESTTEETDYSQYVDSKYLINDTDKTIYDYVNANNPLKGTKAKIKNISETERLNMVLEGTEDDYIVQIIPKNLFSTTGEYLIFGKEYGFFITTELNDYNYSSIVMVFSLDYNMNLEENVDTASIEIKVLFELSYAYLPSSRTDYVFTVDNNSYSCEYNISQDIVALLPSHIYLLGLPYSCNYDDVDLFMLKDVGMGISLYNEQEKNIGDLGYNPYNDIGSYLTSYDYYANGQYWVDNKFQPLNTQPKSNFEKTVDTSKTVLGILN